MIDALEQRLRQAVGKRLRPRPKVPVGTGAGTGTLYFLTPDLDVPSGGIRVIYRHVDVLNAAGIDAVALHQNRDFRCTWFENRTRTAGAADVEIGRDDVLVVPEQDADLVAALPLPVRHIVFNQSGHLTWRRGGEALEEHYRTSSDLLGMIVVSQHSEDLLSYAYPDRAVRRVHLSLDPEVFHPGQEVPRGRTLAYLPRRGGAEIAQVLNLLGARDALGDWTVQALGGMPQRRLADAMRASSIVLSTSYQEGFGLPAVEAMACGNHVVGFHGFGGREFFRPQFSAPVETGDVVAAARALERAMRREEAEPGWCLERGLEASRFVLATYTPQRERDDVLAAYADLLARVSDRPADRPTGPPADLPADLPTDLPGPRAQAETVTSR